VRFPAFPEQAVLPPFSFPQSSLLQETLFPDLSVSLPVHPQSLHAVLP
jgi:hypothetical protein